MRAYRAEEIKFAGDQLTRQARMSKSNKVLNDSAGYWTICFAVPVLGWRVGLDALVGLIPGVGDTATTLASLYILTSAVRYRVPKITLLRMGLNLGIDYAVGALPLVGDFFDAWWKSNQKNIDLLRKRATVSASEAREGKISDWLFVGLIILLLVGLAVGAAVVSVFLLDVYRWINLESSSLRLS